LYTFHYVLYFDRNMTSPCVHS